MSKGKSWYGERSYANIPIGTINLIICCGAETEKNYFDGVIKNFKARKNIGLLKFINEVDAVDPMGMANNLAEKIAEIKNVYGRKPDHVWVLFDKDDFPDTNFNNAISKIQGLSDEETKCHALWSNECFELWLLLNFINLQSAIDRQGYIDKLEKYLHEKYNKNDKYIFEKIIKSGGDIDRAIINAKHLISETLSPAKNNPATKVYEFFEYYKTYLGI